MTGSRFIVLFAYATVSDPKFNQPEKNDAE